LVSDWSSDVCSSDLVFDVQVLHLYFETVRHWGDILACHSQKEHFLYDILIRFFIRQKELAASL
jgi:hypothetical protein